MTVLAEKLARRKDLVTRIGRLDDEIASAIIFEEGDTAEKTEANRKAAEQAADAGLLALNRHLDALQDIENEIREANTKHSITFENSTLTISQAIVLRDRLKTEYSALDTVAKEVEQLTPTGKRSRYGYGLSRRSKEEINLIPARTATQLREAADIVARRVRLLDIEIQKVNWSAEVD